MVSHRAKQRLLRSKTLDGTDNHIENGIVLRELPTAVGAAFNTRNKQDKAQCLPGTRVEILSTIQQWTEAADGAYLLWICGMAGTGKSTIALTLANILHKQGLLGASFFFDRNGDESLRNMNLFYTTIAKQLAEVGHTSLTHHIRRAARIHPDVAEETREFQWKTLIVEPLRKIKSLEKDTTYFIVIDALDECENDSDIEGLLKLLPEAHALNVKIRIVVVSRSEPPLRVGFANLELTLLQKLVLEKEQVSTIDRDINFFLDDQLTRAVISRGVLDPQWPRDNLIKRLVRLSAGLFIYAATAISFVQQDVDRTYIDDSLSCFVETMEGDQLHNTRGAEDAREPNRIDHLDELCDCILSNSLQAQKTEKRDLLSGYIKDLLGALIALREPLTPTALQTLRGRLNEDVRERLGRLHSVVRVPVDDTSNLQLFHTSFRDYLLNSSRRKHSNLIIKLPLAHDQLFKGCKRILEKYLKRNLANIRHPGTLHKDIADADTEERLPSYVQYSCKHWVSHLTQSVGSADDARDLLKQHLTHWMEAMSLMGSHRTSQTMVEVISELRNYVREVSPEPF